MRIICDKCREAKEEALEIFEYHFCKDCRDDLNVITIHWVMNMCEFKKQKPKRTKPTYIDWDKACALRQAGWDTKKIADELGVEQRVITHQLKNRMEMYLHGMRWGAPMKKEDDFDEWDL